MNIFLVRHAQSESNVDPNVLKMQTNMAVSLSHTGLVQAKETAIFLANNISNASEYETTKIWNSPYNRTRQTAKAIKEQFSDKGIPFIEEESIYIAERQFGLVDDAKNYIEDFKHEANHYKLHKDSNHDFFARPPLGESPFDMCIRLDFFLKVILGNDNQIKNHIVVSHGAAIRGLIMMHQKQQYEEYTCPNPANASVRCLSQSSYMGEIFKPTKATY